jgi:hypothetical protein
MFKVGLNTFVKIQTNVTTCKVNWNSSASRSNIGSILFLNQWHVKYNTKLWKFS